MSDYSIWILEYAYVPEYPVGGVIYGAHNAGTRKLPYCYVLIKGNGHVAMVDVGYNHAEYGRELADRFGVTGWKSPEATLAKCGVHPDDVDTVFITHGHFDHFGNVAAFPNARFYIQGREIEKWVWAMSLPKRLNWMMTAVDPADVLRAVELAKDGRLVCVDGDMDDALPGIDLKAAFDTHTFGSMYIEVRNDGPDHPKPSWILAGDLVYVYENVGKRPGTAKANDAYVPVGLAVGSQSELVLTTERMMKAVNYDYRRVIPVHEERLKDEFPSVLDEDGLRLTEICVGTEDSSRIT